MNFTYTYELTRRHEKAAFWSAWPAAILGALLYIGEIVLSLLSSSSQTALSATIVSVVFIVPLVFMMLLVLSSLLTWMLGYVLMKCTENFSWGWGKFFIWLVVLVMMPLAAWACDSYLFSSLSFYDRVAHAIWWPIGALSNVWLYFSLFSPAAPYDASR